MSHAKISSKIAMLLMVMDALALTFLDSAQKYLAGFYTPPQVVLMYKGGVFLCALPWILREGLGALKTKILYLHAVRSLLSMLAVLMFVIALQHVTVADLSALAQLQGVFLTAIGMMFFNEKFSKTKLIAILIAFMGAITVTRPDLFSPSLPIKSEVTPYYIIVLLGVIFFTINSVTVKVLGRTESNKTQLFYLTMFASLWALPLAIIKWDMVKIFGFQLPAAPSGFISTSEFHIEPTHLLIIASTMLCYLIHNMSYYNALKADLGVVMPFKYMKIVFSAILGYFLFGETGHVYSYVGYGLIIFAGLLTSSYVVRQTPTKAVPKSGLNKKSTSSAC